MGRKKKKTIEQKQLNENNQNNNNNPLSTCLEALTDVNEPENNSDNSNSNQCNIDNNNNNNSQEGEELNIGLVEKFLDDATKIHRHYMMFLTLKEEKENLSKQILRVKDEYENMIKEKDKIIQESTLKYEKLSSDFEEAMRESKIEYDNLSLGFEGERQEFKLEYNELESRFNVMVLDFNNLKSNFKRIETELEEQKVENNKLAEFNVDCIERISHFLQLQNKNLTTAKSKSSLLPPSPSPSPSPSLLLSTTPPSTITSSYKFKNQISSQFLQNISALDDKIHRYVTHLRAGKVELCHDNVKYLLTRNGYRRRFKEKMQRKNKMFIKSILQKAVFEKLIELLKDLESSDYYKTRELREEDTSLLEYDLYKLTEELCDKANKLVKNRTSDQSSATFTVFSSSSSSSDLASPSKPFQLVKTRKEVFDILYRIGYNNDDDNDKEHEFIAHNKQLLDQHINQYRIITDPEKRKELDKLSGEIIKDFIRTFYFIPLEDLNDLEICWVCKGSIFDPELMESQLGDDNIDECTVEVCKIPLIRSPKKIYSRARVFTEKIHDFNTAALSYAGIPKVSLEIIKWKNNDDDNSLLGACSPPQSPSSPPFINESTYGTWDEMTLNISECEGVGPKPFPEKHPQTIIPPSPCLTDEWGSW